MIGIATLLALAAVEPATVAPQDPVIVTGELPDDKKKVCKQMEEIGSIIPRKVCKTKGEWASTARGNEKRSRAYADDKNSMSSRVKRPGGAF